MSNFGRRYTDSNWANWDQVKLLQAAQGALDGLKGRKPPRITSEDYDVHWIKGVEIRCSRNRAALLEKKATAIDAMKFARRSLRAGGFDIRANRYVREVL